MAPRSWIVFDWGGTLMSEEGPLDIPMALWPEVHAIAGARETLAALAKRHRIAVATNASVSKRNMIEAALGRVGLRDLVSEVFCFSDIGARKDSDEFWRAVLERLRVEPSEVLMIGDSLEQDVLAPRRFGIDTIWFNQNGARAGGAPGVRVATRLPDLIAMIDGPGAAAPRP
jgi:HAD superfamily hydrolase (TIGR01662 family)